MQTCLMRQACSQFRAQLGSPLYSDTFPQGKERLRLCGRGIEGRQAAARERSRIGRFANVRYFGVRSGVLEDSKADENIVRQIRRTAGGGETEPIEKPLHLPRRLAH